MIKRSNDRLISTIQFLKYIEWVPSIWLAVFMRVATSNYCRISNARGHGLAAGIKQILACDIHVMQTQCWLKFDLRSAACVYTFTFRSAWGRLNGCRAHSGRQIWDEMRIELTTPNLIMCGFMSHVRGSNHFFFTEIEMSIWHFGRS